MLGNRVVIDAWRGADSHPGPVAGRQIDGIKTDAGTSDCPQRGQSLDYVWGIGLGPGNDGFGARQGLN